MSEHNNNEELVTITYDTVDDNDGDTVDDTVDNTVDDTIADLNDITGLTSQASNSEESTSIFRTHPLYALDHVSLRGAKDKLVIDSVSLQCHAGKAYALLVPQEKPQMRAALLAIMSGVIEPSDGDVMSKGVSISEYPPIEVRGHRLGLMMQQFMILEDRTALDNLLVAMDASNRNFTQPKKELAAHLLASVHLDEDTYERPAGSLNVLDQHRVALARALAHEPDIIIADEPTAQLDEQDAQAFLETVCAQACDDLTRRTVLVVTSYPHIAQAVGNVTQLV